MTRWGGAPRPTKLARPLGLLLIVPLAYLAAAELMRAVQVALVPWEQQYGESIIYDQAARLLRGEPLYMPYDRPPYAVAAYTPVYYWIAAALQAFVGPGFLPGRLFSIASGLAAAALVGHLAWRRTGDRWAWPFGALLFLAMGMPGLYPLGDAPPPYPDWLAFSYPFFPWMALYKEDVLAVALSLASVALVAGGQARRRLVAAGLLAGLAFMTKQTTVAPALAGTLWLLWHDRRGAIAFAGSAGVLVMGMAGVLELTTGAFFANTVGANVNPFSEDALRLNLKMLGLFLGGPLLLAVLWLVARSRAAWARVDGLLGLYWAATLLPLVGLAKVGSNHNHWLELAGATCVLATLALWATAATRLRALLATLLLALNLAALVPLADNTVLRDRSKIWPNAELAADFAQLVERVRAEPGEVLADPLDVLVLAGRPIQLEPYLFAIFEIQGHWSAEPFVNKLCAGQISLVVTDQPIEVINPGYHDYPHWPWPIYHTMKATLVRESRPAGRFLYVPARAETPLVCSG